MPFRIWSNFAWVTSGPGLSGGGPAYVFLLMEVLAQAGSAAGLPIELAERLARRTIEGAGGEERGSGKR